MGDNIIREPAFKIREIARNTLRDNWQRVIVGLLIIYLLDGVVSLILNGIFYYPRVYELGGEAITFNVGYGGKIYDLLVGGAIEYGATLYVMVFFRKRESNYGLLFEGFSHFVKCFLLALVITIKVFLWTLLFIIPGIIATFRYSQAFYIMIDNPDYSISQCIKESSRIMKGNKGKLFYLRLTFIGWVILAGLPMSYTRYSYVTTSAGFIDVLGIVKLTLLGLPMIALTAYISMSEMAFYELATKHLVVVNASPEDNPMDRNEF